MSAFGTKRTSRDVLLSVGFWGKRTWHFSRLCLRLLAVGLFFAPPMNSLVRECRSPDISWIMTLLTGASLYGEEDQACSKAPSQAPEASGMDETTNPRTQGSLARKDTRCGNLEADQANARRVTAEGAPTRIAAWTFLASELTPSKVPKSYRLFPRLFFRFLSGLCEPRQPLCKFIAAG